MRPRTLVVDGSARLRRHILALLAAILVTVPVMSQAAQALTEDERTFATMMNEARRNHGVRTLRVTERLSKLARKHSTRMAKRGQLFHSNLRRTFRSFSYRTAGENIGYGGSLAQILDAFLDSTPHAQNLLGRWRRAGIGVVWRGNSVWVTQLFLG